MTWIPLNNHSQYSILEASCSVDSIAKKAKELGIPAVALTDSGNLFGAVEFYKTCKKHGIKPIIGCEFYIAPRSRHEKSKDLTRGKTSYRIVLLAKDEVGYRNLCKLSSIGFIEGFYYFPRIDKQCLEQHCEGLICLQGGISSLLSYEILHGTKKGLKEEVSWFHQLFGEDFYFEIQKHTMSDTAIKDEGILQETWLYQQYQDYIKRQETVNKGLVEIGLQKGIRYVATNKTHYLERGDWKAHEILLNIQSGEPCEIWERDAKGNPQFRNPNPKRRTFPSHEFHFKTPKEMQDLFHDLPEALECAVEIEKKCNVVIDLKTRHYPTFVPPKLNATDYDEKTREEEVKKYLWLLCEEGILKRYTPERLKKVKEVYPERDPLEVIQERLNTEMKVITSKGMTDYLLIVWDFIHWTKNQGIPVGPGRGSGAGSIVLYLIGITDIEPLRFHLFFERFINPERLSYPDIDVDICMEQRSTVIEYTLNRYGKENVAQIITFGTMKAKMTIKDVGRVLNVPLSKVNAIAKLVPDDLNITLEKALMKDPDLKKLYQEDEDAKRIIDIGKKLEGSIRNSGIHAAGIIISGNPLTDLIPVCVAKGSDMPVTQFSMKPVEEVGMLKIDFLGLKTLTAIKICVDSIQKSHGRLIDWSDLPLDDGKVFQLLNQGKTLGVFQLESTGMQDLSRQLHLDRFEEIIAVGALYRPGPMDMIPSFINRKHGREPIDYDHPWMKGILEETYGIMVYQEQVMQIAQRLANFSLGEGDVLRRAMGKKEKLQMAKLREKFCSGAKANGIEENLAAQIFDKMEKFAAYGFNKSHAAAYGYLSYVTAYFKANYPKEWLAALMTCDRHDITKVAKYIREAKGMKIKILLPDINVSGHAFVAADEGIRFALSAIKGVGTGVVEAIVKEREIGGPFLNYYQFFQRIDLKKVGKKSIELLVDVGCFDFTDWSRDALKQSIEVMYSEAQKDKKERQAGIVTFFSLMEGESENRFIEPPTVQFPTTKQQTLLKEKELLGFFLTGHPMDDYSHILSRLSCIPFRRLDKLDNSFVFRSAFIVDVVNVRFSSKTQKKFAILTVSDGMVSHELPIWPDLFDEKQHLIKENQLLYAVLRAEKRDEGIRLSSFWLDDLTKADETMIQACDQAFEAANNRKTYYEKKTGQSKASSKQQSKVNHMILEFDLEKVKLTHILQIKKMLSTHPGRTPVKMHFFDSGTIHSILHSESRWTVNATDSLINDIKGVSSVLRVTES